MRGFPACFAASLVCAVLLSASSASADTSPPVKLAVFEFELEDFSAGAALLPANPADSEQLKHVTNEARQLIAQSGRYTLVDISGADAEAAKAHSLRNCDGCDAGIALKFGAQQSLVGIVTRISRTEYTVRFVIHDTQTGATVFNQQTGLRMGAIESWYRGAVWLIKNRLLQNPE
jgi:opacity protein-like surface antigen